LGLFHGPRASLIVTYSVKEIFYTLQGEGANAGLAAVFCRFAGCNLWTGREEDRASAVCQFCDTDFVGTDGTLGGKYATAEALAERVAAQWPAGTATAFASQSRPMARFRRRLAWTGSASAPRLAAAWW
jgi:hypothetical protein